MIDDATLLSLLQAHAPLRPCALVPGVRAWHADDELPLWQALERANGAHVDPPFFAVAWPGAQALARAITDGVVDVRGARVADVGCGSGVAAIASANAGAASVVAVDVDALAIASCRLLAAQHGVTIDAHVLDVLAHPDAVDADIICVGDLVSSARHRDGFARAVALWQQRAALVVADSGRPFFDAGTWTARTTYTVPMPRAGDGAAARDVHLYVVPGPGVRTQAPVPQVE